MPVFFESRSWTTTEWFPSRPESLPDVRRFVRDEVAPARPDSDALDDLVLAVSEAYANAVLHSSSHDLQVRVRVQPGSVEAEVWDQGEFRGPIQMVDPLEANGRGIPVMVALADEMLIRKGAPDRPGTLIRLVKRVAA